MSGALNGKTERGLRIAWLVVAGLFAVIWLSSLPTYVREVGGLSISSPYVLGGRVVLDNAVAARNAAARGLSPGTSAAFEVSF
ncbi:MAG: hypothetical protein ABIQ99_14215, partial [Thermoflexales bacterium]